MGQKEEKAIGLGAVMVGPNEVIIQFDEGLLDLLLGHPYQSSHQDHQREKDFGNHPSQFLSEQDILAAKNREDQKKATG